MGLIILRGLQLRYALLSRTVPIEISLQPKELMKAYVYDGGRGKSIDDAFSELPLSVMPA